MAIRTLLFVAIWAVACGDPEAPSQPPVEPLPASAFAAPAPAAAACAHRLEPRGTIATEIRGLFLRGDHLFVGDDYGGLRVLDVSDPSRPVQLTALTLLTGVSRGIHVDGDHAYLTAADAGLLVFDVSDPAATHLVATLDLPGYTRHAWIEDGLAYVADDWEGFRIVDVQDPLNPREVGAWYDARPGFRVAKRGTVALQASGYEGVVVLDVSDPTAPAEITRIDTPGHAWDVVVRGDYAYVADDVHGLITLAMHNPASPVVVHTHDTPGHARSVYAAGDRLFVADGSAGLPEVPPDPGGFLGIAEGTAGLQVFDLADPASPTLSAEADVDGYGLVVAADEQRAFVGANGAGLMLFRTDRPKPERAAAFTQLPGTARGLAVAGDPVRVFVAAGHAGLRVVDTSNPAIPMEISAVAIPGTSRDVALRPHLALVAAGEGGLAVVDVPRFDVLSLNRMVPTAGEAFGVATDGQQAAVATTAGVERFTFPAIEPLGVIAGEARAVAFADTALIALGPDGLRTVGPTGEVLGHAAVPGGPALAATGTRVVAAGLEAGATLVDVTDPAAPEVLGVAHPPGPTRGVGLVGDRLVVVVGDETHVHSAVHVYDVSDPRAPALEGTSDLIEPGRRVVISGRRAFVTASDGGLRLLDLDCEGGT